VVVALVAAAALAVIGAVVLLTVDFGSDEARPPPLTATTGATPSTRPTTDSTTDSTPSTTPSSVPPVGVAPADLGVSIAGAETGATSNIRGGTSVDLTASGFAASSPVTVTLRSEPLVLGTANADSTGVFRLSVQIPADTPTGTHTLEVSGTGPDGAAHVVSRQINIIDALPNTGLRHRLALAAMALALVGVGLALVIGAAPRRRRTL
jgi:hypothetical protein